VAEARGAGGRGVLSQYFHGSHQIRRDCLLVFDMILCYYGKLGEGASVWMLFFIWEGLIMGWIRKKFLDWLEIVPVDSGRGVSVLTDADFEKEVFRNRVWYRGNVAELAGFYGGSDDLVGNRSFWAEGGRNTRIRKIHSGLPAMMVDVLSDLVVSDFLGIKVVANECGGEFDGQRVWDEICYESGFKRVMSRAVREVLALGDGAFRVSFDNSVSKFPLVDFFGGDRVRFVYERDRVSEVVFVHKSEDRVLEEIYYKDGIRYRLLDLQGREVLGEMPEDVWHGLGVVLAVPVVFDENPRFCGRGRSVFDGKIGAFDALDEVISQWVDALRDGRVQKYIPVGMLPRNPMNGQVQGLSSFDSRFIQTEMDLAEGADNSIKVVQPGIDTGAFEASYAGFLNLALQGVLAPATLGIDLKRGDNATAQREREKATLYTRGKIIEGLRDSLCRLVRSCLLVHQVLVGDDAREVSVTAEFGEYAAPDFGAQVEVVGKGVSAGVISVETAVERLYGDSWSKGDKEAEVARLKASL